MTRTAIVASPLIAALVAAASFACGGEGPCECPGADVAAPTAGAVTSPAVARAPGALPGAELLKPSTRAGRLALDVGNELFSGRFKEIHARFTPSLAESVTVANLGDIVAGVTRAHGAPAQIMDAWGTVAKEEDVDLPAAAALLRMGDEERFRLLLVLTPDYAITGFWLRPL